MPTLQTLAGALASMLVLSACSSERTISGTPKQVTLSVQLQPRADLSNLVQVLGWSAGVPSALVTLVRAAGDGSSIATDSARTDASGLAHFTNLAAGTYAIQASRSLAADELVRASSVLRGVDALGGAITIAVGPGDNHVDVTLVGSGPGTLVFSEIYPAYPLIANGNVYYFGFFFKVYNNSADTIPLAGKLFANPMSGWYATSQYTCDAFAAFKSDRAGVWAQYIYRFPPTAKPLPPGGVAVVATDAIDHRTVLNAPGMFDLSRAGYEFRGDADVLNPLAQGMLSVGPRYFTEGHGFRAWEGRLVFALTDPLDLDTLAKKADPVFGGGSTFVRLPKAALIDVVQWHTASPLSLSSISYCPPSVTPDVDGGEAVLLSFTDTLTIHRKASRTLPDGRVVLQHTRNSAADFEARAGTPAKAP